MVLRFGGERLQQTRSCLPAPPREDTNANDSTVVHPFNARTARTLRGRNDIFIMSRFLGFLRCFDFIICNQWRLIE